MLVSALCRTVKLSLDMKHAYCDRYSTINTHTGVLGILYGIPKLGRCMCKDVHFFSVRACAFVVLALL